MRIVIAGPPKAGKTTLAISLGHGMRHRCTDDVMHLGWSEASAEISTWFDEPGPWCIEGVAVLRALRKWRERNPGKPAPLDRLLMLTDVHEPYSKRGQHNMATQIMSAYRELEQWLAPHLSDVGQVSAVAGQGSPFTSSVTHVTRGSGHRPPVPISCAKTPKSPPAKAKPASKPPRVRGERKFSLAAPPAPAPEPDARAGELAPIVTTSYLQAFEQLGGVKGLVRWGRKNPSAFYRTLAQLAPALGRHAKSHGLIVQVAQFGEHATVANADTGRVIDGTAQDAADDPDPA